MDIDVDIDRNDIKIHIGGNIWTDLASAFEVFFKSSVVHAIQDAVTAGLQSGIPEYADAFFAATDGNIDITVVDNWMIDYQTPFAAIVTEKSLELGVHGLFYSSLVGEEEPATSSVDMPYHDSDYTAGFQVFLSAYTVDSVASSFLEVHEISGFLNSTEIPAASPVQLTTTDLDKVLPGI